MALTSSHPAGDENVILSASDAREVARLLRLLQGRKTNISGDIYLHKMQNGQKTPPPQVGRDNLIARARAILSERNRRTQFLNRAIFGEPAWDMLLGLYVLDGQPVSIGKLVNTVGEPKTTALRWL